MVSDDVVVALTTVDSEKEAKKMARLLVQLRLAACVQISSPVTSFYEWQGKVCEDREWQLLIKLPKSQVQNLKSWIELEHPYDEPELICMDVSTGSESYLKWVKAQCEGLLS